MQNTTATRQLHARAAEAIACCPVEDVAADKSNVAILHQDEEEEVCGEPMDAGRAAEEAVYHAAVVAHRVTSVSTGLRPRSGPEDEVDTQGLVKTLGGIRQWWKATESQRAPLPEGEREPETRTMINAHAAKQGVDLRHNSRVGVLEGSDMAKVFAWMRPNDLIWNYWVNNYLLGNEPPVFDILYWNNDTTRLPAALHGEFIDMFQTNPLTRPGALEVCGTPIDLKQVTCDFFVVAGTKTDTFFQRVPSHLGRSE